MRRYTNEILDINIYGIMKVLELRNVHKIYNSSEVKVHAVK